MSKIDLPYLWLARDRGGRLYGYYRRGKLRIPLKSPDGHRLQPGDAGFLEAYLRIDAPFSVATDRPAR
jgi:hypothetical protein